MKINPNKATKVNFTSTRNKSLRMNFWKSIAQGVSADGGLLTPTTIPHLEVSLVKSKTFWEKSTVSDFSYLIHRIFIPSEEISDDELKAMMKQAHSFNIPLESLDSKAFNKTFVLRIDQGPTASLKDVAARSLSALLQKYCDKHNTVINIVVATSGDTGVAIADAFGGSNKITVTILYPDGGVSEIQEKQMIDVGTKYKNVQAIPVSGNFDVCQDVAKLLQSAREFSDKDSAKAEMFMKEVESKLGTKLTKSDANEISNIVSSLHLSSANSINIWRLIPQMTQYFVAYGNLIKENKIKVGEEIIFAVPTGNVGHLMAGLYAKSVGLPIKKFIVATNANNILANVIGSGTIKHHSFSKTSSPSMDILDPSNLERLLDFAADHIKSPAKIDFIQMKQDIKRSTDFYSIIPLEKFGVTKKILEYLQSIIWAEDIETDDEVFGMMERVFRMNKITMEPHGITALIATIRARAKQIITNDDTVVIMETAHPDKFPTSLKEANIKVPAKQKHKTLDRLAKIPLSKMQKSKVVPANLLTIAKRIKAIAN